MSTSLACWNCGAENPPGSKFCSNCGKAQRRTCPECGAEAVEGAKFCVNCGIRLRLEAPAATEGPAITAETRKVVTVLFADLAGSTGLTERLDPEEARDVIGKFYTVVRGVVEEWYAGSIANYLGDGVLAVFGLPTSHEDDPERAVRAGLAIQQAMPVLNTHLASTHGVHLAARIGINTGEVVAESGSTFQRDFLVSDAVTTAARLQQTVAAGTVVVGERTYRLTKESIEYRELPPLAVKGKEGSLKAWAAVVALPERAEIRRITAPLVGRHGELGILRSLYVRSRDAARVHLVTILGQPGVGKSRLLREFLAEVRDTEPAPLVLRGRSVAFGGQIGYHALLDVLRFQAGLMDTDPPDVVRTKLTQWLAEMVPDRDLLEGLLLTYGAEDGDPERMRQKLFEAWQTLVSELATARPVILAFEDAHWADEAVLDLIDMLVAHATGVPLFVICLARPELLERRPGWAGGRRNASSIEVDPLLPQEAEQLVGALGSQGLPAETAKMIAQRAEGNPLFIEELMRMMLEGSTPGAQIPDTVQAVLTARIDRLQPGERLVLQAGSVIGRTFWPSAVAAIVGLSSEETAQALDALVAKEFIVRRPKSTIADENEFAFRHILTRDVAYNLLPRAQRQRAHAQTVRWIESHLERHEEVIEILAEHLRVAGDERAAEYLYRAGAKARRQYANADAIRLFTQALEAAGEGGPPTLVASIYHERGDVYQLTGEYQRAMADYEAGLGAAREAGDQALMARLQNKIGLTHHRQMRLDAAERSFQQAAHLAREVGDRLALGQTLVDLANIAWDRGAMPPDHPAIVEGLALLREAGDDAGVARGLNLLVMSHLGAGSARESVASAQEALAAARAAGDRSREATALSYLCVVHGFLGRYAEGLPYGFEALQLAETIGDRRRIAYTRFFIGRIQTSYGQWAEARTNLEQARGKIAGLARIQYPWLYYFSGLVHDLVGEPEQAKVLWRAGAAVETNSPAWRQISLLSAITLAGHEGDTDGVHRALDEVLALPAGGFIPSDVEAVLGIGEALLDGGRPEDLERYLAARRQGIERLGTPPGLAALALLDARLAARAGDRNRVPALLDVATAASTIDAVRLWRTLELRLELLNRPEDRAALQEFIQKMAASLPDDLRTTFLSSPRVVAGGGGGG